MQFSVLQENFAKGLGIVGRAVNSRSSLPILGNVLIEARADALRLSATNLQVGINCLVGAKVEAEGSITVPAQLLTAFVNSLPSERIDATLNTTTQTLTLACGGFRSNIRGMAAEDYPQVGKHEMTQLTQVDAPVLCNMIEQVAFAASRDESRPALSGVELRYHPRRMSLAATDGYRLAVRRLYHVPTPEDRDDTIAIVPATSLAEVARISGECEDDAAVTVTLAEGGNQISFDIPGGGLIRGAEVVSQLVSGRYPDYSAIIPKRHDTSAEVDRGALLKALRVVGLFAKQGTGVFCMEIGAEGIALSAEKGEIGDSTNKVDATITGAPLTIHFNVAYWIDVLSRIDDERVVITATEAGRPAMVRPVSVSAEEFVHVVMPMHNVR